MIRSLTVLALAAALTACGVLVENRPQRRFVGPVSPTADPANCPATRGVLIMRQNLVTFAPDEGSWVLDGVAGPDALSATRSRPGADRKLYKTELQARWTAASVNGTYTTPHCTYRVELAAF